jgi:integrase
MERETGLESVFDSHDQIQQSLGHASLNTTQRYLGLGLHQDLADAPCDYLRLNLAAE